MASAKRSVAETVADEMADKVIGVAVLALADAGKPVSVQALIDYLLRPPGQTGLPHEWEVAAARRLGSDRQAAER